MKNNDVPISLFSFQDIITSLTGIMVIVILVIALQMVEASMQKPADPEFARLTELLKEREKELEKLQNTLPDLKELEILKPFLALSLEELEAFLNKEKDKQTTLTDEGTKLRKTLEILEEELRQILDKYNQMLKTHKALMAQYQAKTEKTENKLEEIKEKTSAIKEEIRVLLLAQKDLKKKATMMSEKLAFSFEGKRTHTPILVECAHNGFHASVYLTNDIKHFTEGSFNTNLDNLVKWLKTFDCSQYYPVLLCRQSAFTKMKKIENTIRNISPTIKIGKDPLDPKVKVFE